MGREDSPVLPPIDVTCGADSPAHSAPSLRKSISVDSFVRPSRASFSAHVSPSAVIGGQDEHSRSFPTSPSWRVEFASSSDRPPPRSRIPNSSSSTADDNSDDALHGIVLKTPRHPVKDSTFINTDKGKERLQSAHSLDHFPSSSSSTIPSSGLPRPRSSVFHEHTRGTQSALSQVPSLKRPSPRSRSGSLGVGNSTGGVAMVINTQISTAPHRFPVTIAVVGTLGCGKSTVIRKGCKVYGMSEPTPGLPTTENVEPFKYTSRIGKIQQYQDSTGSLRVIEVDLSELKLSNPSSPVWPESAPRIDGVIVCYDASDARSFTHVEKLILGYQKMMFPTVVIACKSDMEKVVDPQTAAVMLQDYQVGLVEVAISEDAGKEKMRRCFDWMVKAIYRERSSNWQGQSGGYRNPASPDVIESPAPWENPRTSNNTPTPSQPQQPYSKSRSSQTHFPTSSTPLRSPSAPSSPTRARSTNDLLLEHERSKNRDREGKGINNSRSTVELDTRAPLPPTVPIDNSDDLDSQKEKRQDQRLAPWATLDELLDKLVFSVVSDDDRTYVSNFLLTYRRFARPRQVLLAMQKRMRQLDHQSSDPMFACLAQMSICRLLADWIHDYPHDFAVRDTAGALSALVKSIIAKTHLIHYGLDFLPFLEVLPNLVDQDAVWAFKVNGYIEESDDSYSMFEDEDLVILEADSPVSSSPSASVGITSPPPAPAPPPLVAPTSSRERKQSLPLTAKALVMPAQSSYPNPSSIDSIEWSPKHILRELSKISQELYDIDAGDVAQEITRIETKLFLDIKPRHWLQHTLVSGSKDPEVDTIARFGHVSNHIAEWVVSLILCHDKHKARAKQIEKFVDIGVRLRALNNYSALRAVVAGINSATFIGDIPMELFRTKNPEAWKSYQSWDLLFQAIRSHRAYRMALRNTKGACIPALEVHLLDLIRAHEGNQDYNANDPSKIHWAKYNMIGKFIAGTMQSQDQCRTSGEYSFVERPYIRDLLLKECIMDVEMQQTRIASPPMEDSSDRVSVRNLATKDYPSYPRDAALLRRILFWAS